MVICYSSLNKDSVDPGREIIGAYFAINLPQQALYYLLPEMVAGQTVRGKRHHEEAGLWCLGWKLLMRNLPLKSISQNETYRCNIKVALKNHRQCLPEPRTALHAGTIQPSEGLVLKPPWSITMFRRLCPGLRGLPATTIQSECVPNSTSSPDFHVRFLRSYLGKVEAFALKNKKQKN